MSKYIFNNNRIEYSDVLLYLKKIESNSIDLIIADPPYFEIYGDFDFNIFKSEKEYLDWCNLWLSECKRILKNEGTIILWGSVGKKSITFAKLAIMIEENNIFIRQNWITQRNTRGIGSTKNYMSCREEFLFLTKSNNYTFNIPYMEEKSNRKDLGNNGKERKNLYKRVSNVWYDIAEASQSSIERCEHPTIKAQKICDRIIKTHSNENDKILIPFIGSGSEIISAIKNNRIVCGCENNKIEFDMDFDLNNDKLYCTELINEIYFKIFNENIYLYLYEIYGKSGITINSILKNKNFKEIIKFKKND